MRVRALLFVLVAALVLGVSRGARAADAPGFDGPVAKAVRALGEKGLAPGRTAKEGPSRFRPAKERVVLGAWTRSVADSAEQAAEMERALDAALRIYEEEAAKEGFPDDVAGALAFAVTSLHAVATGTEGNEAAANAMVGQWRAALDVPAVRDAKDADRQAFYEATLAQAFLLGGLADAAAGDAEALAKVRAAAGTALEGLVGAPASRITLSEKGISILAPAPAPAPAAAPAAPAAPPAPGTDAAPGPGGLAPGFSVAPPEGWTRAGDWHVLRKTETPGGGPQVTSAMFRFLPAVRAEGNMGDALRRIWAETMPKGLQGRHTPMVYRRFVGNGALAQFVYGEGREEGRLSDTAYTLYLVECGTWWQPVVQAQIYEEPGSAFVMGIEMSARTSFPTSTAMAEPMLAAFRVAGDLPKRVADESLLRGIWVYGTSNAMQWVNSVTGAYAGMTAVSYANWMDLRADGTFRFYHQGASGAVGAMKFAVQEETGRWRVEGDVLVLEVDDPPGRVRRHRIVGVNHFAEGKRILSLIYLHQNPPTNLNCLGSDSYASTDTFGPPK